jgi:phage terminase small subunit
MKNSEQIAKETLSPAARKLRKGIVDTWELADPSGIALLDELCCCYDRLQEAKAGLKQHGAVMTDRFGQAKMSPWFLAVRDETSAFVRLSKALNLEVEGQDHRPGRPDGWVPE